VDQFTLQPATMRDRRATLSAQTIISRLSVLVLALAIALFTLIGKRWDDVEAIWLTRSGSSIPGTPSLTGVEGGKEYVICTRSRKGIYTVDDIPDGQATAQCMVVNSEGKIAATGRIGKYFFFLSRLVVRLELRNLSPRFRLCVACIYAPETKVSAGRCHHRPWTC
jgi:hypothetical protein